MNYKSIIFTSDIFRVDDRNLEDIENPQRVNVSWIYQLFAPILSEQLGCPAKCTTGDELQSPLSRRLDIFKHYSLPFNSTSWAKLYHSFDEYPKILEYFRSEFEGSLVFGIELPPSHIKAFEELNIDYIDLSIHPIRFLQDYLFGFRTNVRPFFDRMYEHQLPAELIDEEVRVSKSRSARIYNRKLAMGSALFLGQLDVDASLIANGQLMNLDDVEGALTELSLNHTKVYYKFHPHQKDKSQVMQIVNRIQNCEVLDINIYVALSQKVFDLVAALSSGSLYEANLYGQNTKRFISVEDNFTLDGMTKSDVFENKKYISLPSNSNSRTFWSYLLGQTEKFEPVYPQVSDWVKHSLNMKWGK